MAAAEPAQSQPRSAQRTVGLHGFEGVLRTGRMKPATAAERPEERRQHRRNGGAVEAHGEHEKMLGWIHGTDGAAASVGRSKPARLSAVIKSFSTPASFRPTADERAMRMRSTGCASPY